VNEKLNTWLCSVGHYVNKVTTLYTKLCAKQKVHFWLATLIFIFAYYVRFAHLKQQGFWDSDEYASYLALTGDVLSRDLRPYVQGNLWGRPFGFLTSYFFMKIFGFSPYAIHIKSALFGFLTVVIGYIIGERHLGKYAGLFSSALMAGLYSLVYYSRTMKMTAPSMFFCAIAIWILFETIRSQSIQKYSLCGLMNGFMVTTHPATIPMAFSILAVLATYTIIKEKSIGTSVNYGLLTLLGFAIPLIGCELFYIRARLLPWWHTTSNSDYIKFLLFKKPDGASYLNISPTIHYFFGELRNNGKWLTPLIVIAQLVCLACRRKPSLINAVVLAALFWLPILIYSHVLDTKTVIAERDIFTSLFPGILSAGFLLAKLAKHLKGIIKLFFLIAVSALLVAAGAKKSLPIIQHASAAQEIYDTVGSERASMTRPSKSVYQWEEYYFTNEELSVNNWNDVLKNFLLGKANYLVQLLPSWTAATGFDTTKKYATPFLSATAENHFLAFYLYTPSQLERILKDKFGLKKISSTNLSGATKLSSVYYSNSIETLSIEKPNKIATINVPLGANLIAISGKIRLKAEAGETIFIALGPPNTQGKLYMKKAFSPRKESDQRPNEIKTNIFFTAKIPGNIHGKLAVYVSLTKRRSLHNLIQSIRETFSPFSAHRRRYIENFSVNFYNAPKDFMPAKIQIL
jgi:4-amino-4-deoxy-L-arabinose transferase-like glycosyltransferase